MVIVWITEQPPGAPLLASTLLIDNELAQKQDEEEEETRNLKLPFGAQYARRRGTFA